MRTGLKTLARKGLNQFKHPSFLYRDIPKHTFPDKPTASFKVKARLHGLKSELKERNINYNLGSLYTLPHIQATQAYQRFIDYNPSNLGSWSEDATQKYNTTQMEYEVIHNLIDLYHGSQENLGGYITSGGTEANIFCVWMGRTHLEQHSNPSEICLLKTSLTHYSIRKAGQLCNIPQFLLPLSKTEWNIDLDGFRSSIKSFYKQGYRGFIVPLTLGYTATGTCDNVEEITKEADKLKKTLPGINFYFWIDAAFNGLITPFLVRNFQPFYSQNIQALVVDFHKFGLVPYPAGIVLHRNKLLKLIENSIDYLWEQDTTLLGSRSGVPAISIWTMIHTLGKKGYGSLVKKQMKNKEYFLEQIKLLSPKIQVITDPHSLTCGVTFYGLTAERLPQTIEDKYSLYPGKTKLLFYPKEEKTPIIYKFFFLPHLKRGILKEFFNDYRNI